MSRYEEDSIDYQLYEARMQEFIEKIMEFSEERIYELANKAIKAEHSDYVLDHTDLITNILQYYKRHKKLSTKQKLCLCRAIADIEYFYKEIGWGGYFYPPLFQEGRED